MHFTPGQLRATVGISAETYRHWRRVLPDFVERRGYTPCFSTGDLLAASILKLLTDECGIRIGFLDSISTEIVRLCNASPWAALEDTFLVLDLPGGQCQIVKGSIAVDGSEISVVCALNPILNRLRDVLLKSHPVDEQAHLRFPLLAVATRTRARRRRA